MKKTLEEMLKPTAKTADECLAELKKNLDIDSLRILAEKSRVLGINDKIKKYKNIL
jgi:hypothetical protein